ncbi:MAG: hypothetical protein AB1450_08130 [Pseudomonadota bacterium]
MGRAGQILPLSAAGAEKVGGGGADNLRRRQLFDFNLLMLEAFFCRVWSIFAPVGLFSAPICLFSAPVRFLAAPLFISLSLNQLIEREREKMPGRGRKPMDSAAHVYLRKYFKCARFGALCASELRRLAQGFLSVIQSDRGKIGRVRKCAVCYLPPSSVEA